ncbi:isopeptide-forming domain-containing fimbrial protein [uncultured Ruminococcus sp.]|uniref:isopeptide-forming domain-containing fimbrial protein n=1 Tax=uncultured Ruminococcus sp. TaxID=165186 RepID=UPI0025FDE5E5|nr:isopeptide-forming domain-containing fimbrial protein [uncultured Ruminococcus sp.]
MKMKKFAALAAATIMTVSAVAATSAFSVFATAENTNRIVITDEVADKTYVAYQIFDQTSATNAIDWASDVDDTHFIEALKSDMTLGSKFDNASTAADVAKIISDKTNWTDEDTAAFAKVAATFVYTNGGITAEYSEGKYTLNVTNAGYYLIIDETNNTNKDNANSAYILNVSGKTDVTPKVGQPTLTKEIKHNENGDNGWGVVGDNQIGDDVEFRITTTIPSEVQYYDTYTYTIHDQLSEGFDLPDNAECFFYDKNGTKLTSVTFTPVINKNQTDNSFVIQFNIKDLLAQNPDIAKIETYYSAKLNGNAKVADKATNSTDNNPNTAYLTYSNNPKDESDKEDGRTPDSKVYDWTFTLAGKKEDDKGNALAGAKFQLKRDNKVISLYKIDDNNFRIATAKEIADGDKIVDTIVTVADGIFNIKGIDDTVEYTLEEIEAPADYNKAAPTKIKLSTGYKQNTDGTTDGTTFNYLQISQDDNSGVDGNGVTVVNRKGSELPSTGGIGTQIFYGVGGAIVVGAGVLLITKKRAKKD